MDLIIVIFFTLIAFPVFELTEGVLRTILGVIFLFLFPGYSLMAALFPSKTSMKGVERAVLTFVLSFALVSLAGLALNFTPWGIRLTPIFTAMAIIIFISSGIAFLRRRSLPDYERFVFRINIPSLKWSNVNGFDRMLSIILSVAIIAAAFALAYVITQPKAEEAFTNFYVLGPEGKIENYPKEITIGEEVEIMLGIENNENQNISYEIMVLFDEEEIQEISPIILADNEAWSKYITFTPSSIGENQKVEFLLYKGEESVPYLNLHLWLNVKE